MKTILGVTMLLGLGLGAGQAQGVFNFTLDGASEVPPNSSASGGTGSILLTGNNATYTLTALLIGTTPVDAGVFGPASPGANGPMIFDLGTPTVTPLGGETLVSYSGEAPLTGTELAEMQADETYVTIYTSGYPGGEIRGQITLVPEPASVSLMGVGAGVLWLLRRKKA